jgi:signal peptidase
MNRRVRLGVEVLAAVAVIAVFAAQVLGVPLGLAFVETGSMEPTMEPGDGFVALPPAVLGGVEEGDVVTFEAETIQGGRLTTHRVVGTTDGGYVTRGDGNPFTDQQGGEPPVTDEQVVAEAVQVGGEVLVIPNLQRFVRGLRGLFASIGARIGLSVNQVIAFIVVGGLAAYLLDETEAGEDRTERSPGRATGFSGTLLVGGAVAVVVAAATISMVAASGAVAVPYDSVGPDEAGAGGIPARATENGSVELTNAGLVPMNVVLSTDDPNATLARERVYLGPQSNTTVNVSITAPAEPGSYETTVERRQYLAVLPGSMLSTLSNTSHWLAIAVVDLLLAGVVALIGHRLLGGGRVRLRPTRAIPIEINGLRWLRKLYRSR